MNKNEGQCCFDCARAPRCRKPYKCTCMDPKFQETHLQTKCTTKKAIRECAMEYPCEYYSELKDLDKSIKGM